MTQPRARLPRSLPLHWHLVLLVTGTLLPLVLFSAIMVHDLALEQKAAATRRLAFSARLMSEAVEREISSSTRALEALAESARLDRGDLKGFHAEAVRVRKSQPSWVTVILITPEGQQLINTLRPWGTPLPTVSEPASLRRLVVEGRPLVGNLARGRLDGKWAFPVRVPVRRGGKIRYVLTAAIAPEALTAVVAQQLPPREEWTRGVVDRDGVLVARTRDPERFIGHPSAPWFRKAIRERPDDVVRGTSLDGVQVYSGYWRSSTTGWTASVTAPVAVVEGPLRSSLQTVVGAGLALLVLSGVGAYALSIRVSQGISAAADAAEALADEQTPRVLPSAVSEVARLGEALTGSAQLLQQRSRERDDLLARAEEARLEAETASRSKDEFLALLGHELRNPLAPIVTALEILRLRGQGETREWQVIQRQVKHLSALVDDLLDVSRITRGKVELRRQDLELHTVVTHAVETVTPLITERRQHLMVDVPEQGLMVHGDARRLAQVVGNLLTNAAKYTPAEGEIRVRAACVGAQVELTVSDNGQGLSAELLPRIFDAFVQGPRGLERQEGGLGLGLALVRNLVALHGGTVEAHSEGLGKGSVFRVQLPAAEGPEREPGG